MLYDIIIYPIELIIEMIYFVLDKTIENSGLCIIGVSLAIQLLTLPLYNIAEKWQAIERDTQKKMKPKIDKIKAVFKGDEQYMMLSTLYKQQGYHPIFALRSTLGLLIQVPFFIAAYAYLSNLEILQGRGFYFIQDLGSPDGLFMIGTISINILPIAMTLINIFSSMIYTKGFSLREKLQLYVMALLFLVLLYNSPSALVLYWTFNNVFALVKNLICKAKKPLKVFYILASMCGIGVAAFSILDNQPTVIILFSLLLAFVIIITPLIIKCIDFVATKPLQKLSHSIKKQTILFSFLCITLFLLAGIFIPSALMVTSSQEFSFIDDVKNPLEFIGSSMSQAAGFFLLWIPIVYALFSKKIKTVLTWLGLCVIAIVLLNTFILTGNYGNISPELRFDTGVSQMPPLSGLVFDFAVIAACLIAIVFIVKYVPIKYITSVCGVMMVSLFCLSFYNVVVIQKEFTQYEEQITQAGSINVHEPVYSFSSTNKNVLIIMLDRGINSFVPYIFEEFPETAKQFSGFTYYPNTVSSAGNTLTGVPGLFGGHEYLPELINERESESLVEKHNEALSVLPVTFLENGFNTTITDAPWANYSWVPDNRIFSEWEDINAVNLIKSNTLQWASDNNIDLTKQSELLYRNLLFFSFFRMFPNSLRGAIYDNGRWWQLESTDAGTKRFLDSYAILDILPELTTTSDTNSSFIFMTNDATHEPIFLQYPEYEPVQDVPDTGNNIWNDGYTHVHYHSNVAALKKLGEWFDYLREKGVYDNTRIIIVSDHGRALSNIPDFEEFNNGNNEQNVNPSYFNALFMIKDFNKTDFVKTDTAFMTTPDLPYFATQNVIEDAKNPFTGKPFVKNGEEFTIQIGSWNPKDHHSNTMILDEKWTVKENIFELENWTKVE